MANTDGAQEAVAETEEVKKKGPPVILIGMVAALVLLAGSAGAYFMIFANKPDAHAAEKKGRGKNEEGRKKGGRGKNQGRAE